MPITVSWATPIASGSSRASMAGAEAAPGGTGAGRYVNLVSCQMPGPPRGQTPGSGKQQTSCSGSGGMPVTRRGLRGTCPGRAAVACP